MTFKKILQYLAHQVQAFWHFSSTERYVLPTNDRPAITNRYNTFMHDQDILWATLEITPVAVILLRDEKILYANPAYHRLSGYSASELSGMSIYSSVTAHPTGFSSQTQ